MKSILELQDEARVDSIKAAVGLACAVGVLLLVFFGVL